MQSNINTSLNLANERFYRIFQRLNVMWFVIASFSLTSSAISALSARPSYLHDWHVFAIIFLSISMLAVYFVGAFRYRATSGWPPPLRYALTRWISLYVLVTLLTLIDQNFVWSFFIVFGMSFALFGSYFLVLLVSIIFVSFCIYAGWLTWPFTGDNLWPILSVGIGLFAMTAFSMMVQHLISERFERNTLLQKLTEANAELEEAHRQLAESAAQEQELAVLRERTRVAREMHDTLGHALVLISIKLEAARRLRERDPQRCDSELEATGEIVRTTMQELRASIANLRSPALEREPACRAISRYAREMGLRAGLHVTHDLDSDIEGLPEQVEETLWKVGQEALTNIEKHAQARNVLLHIRRGNGHVLMSIQDDGVGLPSEFYKGRYNGEMQGRGNFIAGTENQSPTTPGHYGLHGMTERVESLGGRLTFSPAQDHGTIIEVELPLVETPF
ncbi:MAG: sensor histidine kinase [Chloroflexi bacterium]|nr:sensor histidine kinase [Chloroflexota bacterium]